MTGGWKDYKVKPEVLEQARRLGMFGQVEKWIAKMARNATPFTSVMGNRRYESFILEIKDGVVTSICRFDPETGEIITNVMERLRELNSPGKGPQV